MMELWKKKYLLDNNKHFMGSSFVRETGRAKFLCNNALSPKALALPFFYQLIHVSYTLERTIAGGTSEG